MDFNSIKEFIKEIRKDKRKSAIASLGVWFLFFLIVFILIGGINAVPSSISYGSNTNKKSTNTGNSLDNFSNMSNYEYSYLIEASVGINEVKFKIDGTYYDGINYFEFENDKYMIKDDVVYLINEENKELNNIEYVKDNKLSKLMDIRLLNKTNLGTLLKSSEETTKTSYKDGGSQRTLVYRSSDGKSITFIASEYSNLINSIDIDFKKYFTNFTTFKVSVALKNINNIDNYAANYKDYKIIEKGE